MLPGLKLKHHTNEMQQYTHQIAKLRKFDNANAGEKNKLEEFRKIRYE